jgi:hypothetical protein
VVRATLTVVEYHCVVCGKKFGDPELARSFDNWELMVREHMSVLHHVAAFENVIGQMTATPLSLLVLAEYS